MERERIKSTEDALKYTVFKNYPIQSKPTPKKAEQRYVVPWEMDHNKDCSKPVS